MSRQAGPSIVLSVLIVCFFAVALFQRDLPRTRVSRARSPLRESVARSSPSGPGGTHAGQKKESVRTGRATRQGETSSIPGGFSASDSLDRAGTAPTDSGAHDVGIGRSQMPGKPGLNPPPARSAQASEPAPGRTKLARRAPAAAGPPPKAASARGPRSAFTIAQASETIEGVSSRIYGTAELADSLWRANRDTLPQRDSPLSTGMLLRTPSIR